MKNNRNEPNKVDLSLLILALRDRMSLKRNEIIDILEEIYRLREMKSDRVLIDEVEHHFHNVIEEAKINVKNELDQARDMEATARKDEEKPFLVDLPYYPISCKKCHNEIEGKGVKYKLETYCLDCSCENEWIDPALRNQFIYQL